MNSQNQKAISDDDDEFYQLVQPKVVKAMRSQINKLTKQAELLQQEKQSERLVNAKFFDAQKTSMTNNIFKLSKIVTDQENQIQDYKLQLKNMQKWYSAQIDKQNTLSQQITLLKEELKELKQNKKSKMSEQQIESDQRYHYDTERQKQETEQNKQLIYDLKKDLASMNQKYSFDKIDWEQKLSNNRKDKEFSDLTQKQLKTKIQELEKYNAQISNDRKILSEKNKSLINNIHQKQGQCFQLQEKLRLLKDQHQNLSQRFQIEEIQSDAYKSKIQSEFKIKNQEIQNLHLQLKNTNSKIEQSDRMFEKNQELSQKIQSFQIEYIEIQQSYDEVKSQNHKIKEELQKTQQESNRLRQEISENKELICQLRSRNIEIAEIQQIVEDGKFNSVQKDLRLKEIALDLQQTQEKLNEKSEDLAKSEAQLKDLQEEKTTIQTLCESLQTENHSIARQRSEIWRQNQDLSAKLVTLMEWVQKAFQKKDSSKLYPNGQELIA